jgi:hypothetical protein
MTLCLASLLLWQGADMMFADDAADVAARCMISRHRM